MLRLTSAVGLSKVELRNDLTGGRILDDRSPTRVKALADRYGIRILTIKAKLMESMVYLLRAPRAHNT